MLFLTICIIGYTMVMFGEIGTCSYLIGRIPVLPDGQTRYYEYNGGRHPTRTATREGQRQSSKLQLIRGTSFLWPLQLAIALIIYPIMGLAYGFKRFIDYSEAQGRSYTEKSERSDVIQIENTIENTEDVGHYSNRIYHTVSGCYKIEPNHVCESTGPLTHSVNGQKSVHGQNMHIFPVAFRSDPAILKKRLWLDSK